MLEKTDNPKTLAALGTQDTGRRQKGQSKDTGSIGYTRHRTKTDKTQHRKLKT